MTEGSCVMRLENVKKIFNAKGQIAPVRAVRGVSLEVEKGSMIALKGDSGSGKTTLLQIMGALDIPTSGKVVVNGKNLSELTEAELTEYRAKTVGFVFQSFSLIPNLTAFENVELAMEALNTLSRDERRFQACELLRVVGMGDRMNHRPSKLSGGEQQRVAIARALANGPSIILADEPTGNLDSKTGKKIIKLLDELRKARGTTIILVTHSNKAARSCDRAITIKDGILASQMNVERDEPERILRSKMRDEFDVSGKIVSKLFDADFTDFESIADADVSELSRAIGDLTLAKSLIVMAEEILDKQDGTREVGDGEVGEG